MVKNQPDTKSSIGFVKTMVQSIENLLDEPTLDFNGVQVKLDFETVQKFLGEGLYRKQWSSWKSEEPKRLQSVIDNLKSELSKKS
jgi:hypothetical protein